MLSALSFREVSHLFFYVFFSLHQQFPSFGPASALSKRWLRSQLIDDHNFSDVCIDLLLSHLFLNPHPYLVSHQPQVMFFRFLKLISSSDWFLETIIVNFNDELTSKPMNGIFYFENVLLESETCWVFHRRRNSGH